jgi:4a-hydroxytetrahydrobiopterin dehydratase
MSDAGTTDDKTALTGQQVHDEGLEGWRKVLDKLVVRFETGDFNTGAALVGKIAEVADEANHHPDVDLRYPTVAVHLVTHDVGGLSARDVALARQISGAARDLDVAADPSAVQVIQVGIDAMVSAEVLPFWEAVLGYRVRDEIELVDPYGRWPRFWFQKMDGPRTGRNRIHIDVSVPHDQAESRIAAAVAAGGRVVYQAEAPAFWTLADAEGNEVDIATWQGREG